MPEVVQMDKEQIIKFLRTAATKDIRNDKTTFYKFNEETEFKIYWKEIKQILFKGGFEIEDFYYTTFNEACDNIADWLGYNDIEDINLYRDGETVEADKYTNQLLKWLSTTNEAISYTEDALKETGTQDLTQALQYGQQRHKEQVYLMVIEIINYLVEAEE